MAKRVLIVGGVAGGASAATRLRRLDEAAEIVLFDRGPYVSFANCGLPYFVGNVISDEKKLLVASREMFRDRFNIDVRTEHEVLSVDAAKQILRVKNLREGTERDEPYDDLVLSPGAAPIRPTAPGLDLPGVFAVRTIPDTRRIRSWLERSDCREAVVVGGGFIGLEMAENLVHRGLKVTVLEKLSQVMPPIDPELAAVVASHLIEKGIKLQLGDGFRAIEQRGERLAVLTDRGAELSADLVILALGVRPETKLALSAGLTLGARGGIHVDATMRTSDPHIYAVGDAVEVRDLLLGQEMIVPLAGPANRQGRVAAEAIAGKKSEFRGVQATAIVSVLGLSVATTGASEKGLKRAGHADFSVVYLHPGHHAGYYPGANPIRLKLIFETPSGRILGAQAVGTDGVDKRIDVIATMIQMHGTVYDLAETELCYAPQFGSAKDPVNVAGMMAVNALEGEMPLADWAQLHTIDALLLDVREPEEFARGHLNRALHIPLNQLRRRIDELPKDREIWIYCAAGQRGYFAQRMLMQKGYRAKNLSGGYLTWLRLNEAGLAAQR